MFVLTEQNDSINRPTNRYVCTHFNVFIMVIPNRVMTIRNSLILFGFVYEVIVPLPHGKS